MNILEKICASSRWKHYLLIGILTNSMLSFFLQAITFSITQSGLSPEVSLGFDVFGGMFSLVFFFLALYSYRMQFDAARTCKRFWARWWKDGALLLICITVFNTIPILVKQYVGLLAPVVSIILSGAIYFVLAVVTFWKLSVFIFDLQVEQTFLKEAYLMKNICKRPKAIIATIGVGLWFTFGEALIDLLFLCISSFTQDSLLFIGMDIILVAAGHAMVLARYISYMTSLGTVVYQVDGVDGVKKENSIEKNTVTYLVTACALVFWITNSLYMMQAYMPSQADEMIVQLMEDAEKEINYKKTDEGLRIYVEVERYLEAMSAYAQKDVETLQGYVSTYNDNDFYKRLYYTLTDDVEIAKQQLLLSQADTRLCHDILRHYKGQKTQTEEDKELIEDCIWICLTKGKFIDTTVKFDAESLRKKTVNGLKDQYEEILVYNDLMQIWTSTAAQGKMDQDSVNQLLDMADENPENMAYQILAVMGGSSYLYDEARHYDRVIQCAKRLDNLLEKANPDLTILVEEKLYLAQVAMNCSDYQTALEFLENIRAQENVEVQDTILVCMEQLKKYEEVIQYVDELRKEDTDRSMMDYMAAMSYLKLGRIDEALENGVRLAEKVMEDEENREQNNLFLYSFAEYLSISDSFRGYIDYYYRVDSYTEEQWAIVQQAPLLENYITAINAIYNTREKEVALMALDAVQKQVPDLSLTWYAKGTVYFNNKEYDDAMECFKNCISIDEDNTTAVYCLAVLYDIKGDYEASAKLCEQILDIMPEVNHAKDWYGVSYHTKALYEAIQEYLGGTN